MLVNHLLKQVYKISIPFRKKSFEQFQVLNYKTYAKISIQNKNLKQLNNEGNITKNSKSQNIQQSKMQKIYSLMTHKRNSSRHNFINNLIFQKNNFDTYSKFVIAKDLRAIYNEQNQSLLINSFNKHCHQISDDQFLYCVKKIQSFKHPIKKLNFQAIRTKLYKINSIKYYIKAVFSLVKINPLLIFQKERVFKEQNLTLQINQVFQILYIYQLCKYNLIQIRQMFLNVLRQKIQNWSLKQIKHLNKLLKYSPDYYSLFQSKSFSKKNYLFYLIFFKKQIKQHKIPKKILGNCSIIEYQQIFTKRIQLGLDNIETLLKNYILNQDKHLQSVQAILKIAFNAKQQKNKNFLIIQKQLASLFEFKKNPQKILKKYSPLQIIKLFSFLSKKQQFSLSFWSNASIFLYKIMQNQKIFKQMSPNNKKEYLNYIYSIFVRQHPPQKIFTKVHQMTLFSFAYNKWELKQIFLFCNSLTAGRIGDHLLWLALQKMLFTVNWKRTHNKLINSKLPVLLSNFGIMRKGSRKFWISLKKNLSEKQKEGILAKTKNPDSLIHKYLTIS